MTTRSNLTPPIRIFLDTSVVSAGVISGQGTARALLNLSATGRVAGYVSSYVLLEVRRNHDAKVPLKVVTLETILARTQLTEIDPSPELVAQVVQQVESRDAPVVAAALAANVDALVMFDKKHLLNRPRDIEDAFGLTVVDAGAILTWLTPKQP